MIPVELDWTVPVDGARIEEDQEDGGAVVRYVTARERTVHYRVANLEDPLAIRLLNSNSEATLAEFVARFGLLQRMMTPRQNFVASLESIREDVHDILTFDDSDPLALLSWTNDLLRNAELQLAFALEPDGRRRLVYNAADLKALMFYECAVALDVGAVLARCEQCSKAFLTGPLTGRRSHAKYCSDRCRVAAMRARRSHGLTAEEVR